MKKTMIFGGIVAVIGAILIGAGYAHDGNQNVAWQDGGFKVLTQKQGHQTFKRVKDIQLDTFKNVDIKPYEGNRVKVSYRGDNNITYDAAKQRLTVANKAGNENVIGFFFTRYEPPYLKVYVPKTAKLNSITGSAHEGISVMDLNFNKLAINSSSFISLNNVQLKSALNISGAADANLDNVKAPALKINTNDGDLRVNNSDFKGARSDISTSDGDIDMQNTKLKSSQIITYDGDISLAYLNVAKALTVNTNDGDIDATLKDHTNMTIKATISDGTASIFGKTTTYYRDGNGAVKYQFNSSDGDVTIR